VRTACLLQNDALEKVSRGFREYSRSQGSMAMILGVVFLLGIAAVILYAILSNRDRMVGRRMFLTLARASRLEGLELAFLIRIARRVLPDNPPAIFVRRSLYENAIVDLMEDAALVQSVRQKVYGP
jgi:hypothetical protein